MFLFLLPSGMGSSEFSFFFVVNFRHIVKITLKKKKLCHEFPVFLITISKKKNLFRKLPQLPANMERVLEIS
jgi:hypothetical protein